MCLLVLITTSMYMTSIYKPINVFRCRYVRVSVSVHVSYRCLAVCV